MLEGPFKPDESGVRACACHRPWRRLPERYTERRWSVTFAIIHHTAPWQRSPSQADNLITITSVTSIMSDEIVLRNQTCKGHKGLLWRPRGWWALSGHLVSAAPAVKALFRSLSWWWWQFMAPNVFGITFTHVVKSVRCQMWSRNWWNRDNLRSDAPKWRRSSCRDVCDGTEREGEIAGYKCLA